MIQNTVAMIEWGLLQDATQMKLDVLPAMHFKAEVGYIHHNQELLCKLRFLS
jgi:hypothetical protein